MLKADLRDAIIRSKSHCRVFLYFLIVRCFDVYDRSFKKLKNYRRRGDKWMSIVFSICSASHLLPDGEKIKLKSNLKINFKDKFS